MFCRAELLQDVPGFTDMNGDDDSIDRREVRQGEEIAMEGKTRPLA